MEALRAEFDANTRMAGAGGVAVAARAAAVDELARSVWAKVAEADKKLAAGVALVAVGGYGRRELFPYSDVDLMFLLSGRVTEREVKEPIRRLNQVLWDCGLRVSLMARTLAESGRFEGDNAEFTLSLLDARHVAGDSSVTQQLIEKTLPKLVAREHKKFAARLLEITRLRHAKYGDTIFHLEPNIKECPGGLRDVHVCEWLERLTSPAGENARASPEFAEAREFLVLVRTFLHLRHGRDDNTLDWLTQDEAAAAPLGASQPGIDAAYWMRLYFRHARAVGRRLAQAMEEAATAKASLLPGLSAFRSGVRFPPHADFEVRQNRIAFRAAATSSAFERDAANDPEVALAIFAAMARTGAPLTPDAEARLEDALPVLSLTLEDGPGLWQHLQAILTGAFAGRALRAMHALGILELVIPEFHGIDALVIRDAYHRYTVDEHTFVLIDTLHALRPFQEDKPGSDVWRARFASILRELPHPSLLFLAALLHDTGKGHAASGHALESARMAKNVLQRLELDAYESGLVLDLVRNHLEMSAALRRDVFDVETVRSFAERVPTPEALRMLTLFTYADITAVHPDALTPWKAENLWRLYLRTANYLDRHVDDERVAADAESELGEVMHRVHALLPHRREEVNRFLKGLPRRYLQTRGPDQIRAHFEMAARLTTDGETTAPLNFHFAPGLSELTLVTRDRPMLFATVAGALAAWGMNIVTADAFSNASGLVVDSFRFTDTFRTLELNESERGRFVESIGQVLEGTTEVAGLLAARRRAKRSAPKIQVETRVGFDGSASTQSTLLQVVAQDTPGLLRALSLTMAEHGCNIEVALVDTEGEMAIDVFYVTRGGAKLQSAEEDALRQSLLEAIEANAR